MNELRAKKAEAEKTRWLLTLGLHDHAWLFIGKSNYSFKQNQYKSICVGVDVYTDSTCYEGSVYFD